MKILLIGGTGNISSSITRMCLERGDDVYLLNRGNDRSFEALGAKYIIGDAFDADSLKESLKHQSFDVAANFILFTPEHARANYEALQGRVGQFIFVSSCTVYQKPILRIPVTPDTPLNNPYSDYAQNKAACEEFFVDCYRKDGFPITVVRPSHTYGEKKLVVGPTMGWRVPHWTLVERMLQGKAVIVHDQGRTLWTTTHSDDFAFAFVGLLGNHTAIGHRFHITNDEPHTWNSIMQTYGEVLGIEIKIAHVPTDFIVKYNEDARSALYGDMLENAVFDLTKLREFVPGYRTRVPLRAGLERSINWYRNHPEAQKVDEKNSQLTDQIISEWQKVLT